ncbi:HVO_A0556 family zinc finger protein [Haloterrigena salifodinae]|uniref:HVO_A0556 family zinc finger protein n=1 Tax=Haloterrigena salifodinae TaxID=2675099 RepID=UPI002D218D6A|nr:HVO_A0556 family zinc finger protein [Haloterrigena salifodinae]
MASLTDRSLEATDRELLARLEHCECTYCRDGSLVRDQYKGNTAVICDQCGVPSVQLWDAE